MHSIIKIFRRYILTASIITISILFLNVMALLLFGKYYSQYNSYSYKIQRISDELSVSSGKITVSKSGYDMLKSQYVWAILLNDKGTAIWSWNLPKEIPTQFTAPEIAAFSKWYLKDYPVNVWKHGNGLLVAGGKKNSLWKYGFDLPQIVMEKLPGFLLLVLIINIFLILLLSVLFGLRFYRSLRSLANGIEQLARQEHVNLPEKGITTQLSQKLNETSLILETQSAYLTKRDSARTNWISGVSHDIRTPLSMIMGYAESLESDTSLDWEQQQQASIIKMQSMKIKKLIEDLNLTSKLEYNMQPLRIKPYSPAALLREIVTSYYNNGLSDQYSIHLNIDKHLETIRSLGDSDLLSRAFQNIIGNSIGHNINGCNIFITAQCSGTIFFITFSDDGKGIPANVIAVLQTDLEPVENQPHIMGLRIVKQIVTAHQGTLEISTGLNKESEIRLTFPYKD